VLFNPTIQIRKFWAFLRQVSTFLSIFGMMVGTVGQGAKKKVLEF